MVVVLHRAILALLLVLPAFCACAAEPLPVVKLSPQIRADAGRGQAYFDSLDCAAASQAVARTADEQRWLTRRLQQCMERLKVFAR